MKKQNSLGHFHNWKYMGTPNAHRRVQQTHTVQNYKAHRQTIDIEEGSADAIQRSENQKLELIE